MHWKSGLWLSVTVAASVAAQDLKPPEIYQRLLPSVMTLQVDDGAGERYVGTGFLAITNGIAVTAWHVVADARKVVARFADNQFVEVLGLVDKDEKNDLALLRLPISDRPQVQLSASTTPVGSRVYAFGTPKGYDFSISDGLVSQVRNVGGVREYQVSCPISGGNSGGPLVNERGEVIGVACWTKVDAQNLSFATPSSFLFSLDPSLTAKPWGEHDQPASTPAATASGPKFADGAGVSRSEKNLSRFRQALRTAVGEEVTLVVTRGGRKESFTFIVPEQLATDPDYDLLVSEPPLRP